MKSKNCTFKKWSYWSADLEYKGIVFTFSIHGSSRRKVEDAISTYGPPETDSEGKTIDRTIPANIEYNEAKKNAELRLFTKSGSSIKLTAGAKGINSGFLIGFRGHLLDLAKAPAIADGASLERPSDDKRFC